MRLGTRIFSSVNAKSIIFGAVIIFACVAFIFTGFGSLHIANLGSVPPNTAATVGSVSIEMNELSNVMMEQGLTNLSGPEKKMAVAEILGQLIQQKILANESLKMGWEVTEEEVGFAIRSIPLFQDPTTHQFSFAFFKRYLANQQMSEIEFYNYLKTQLSLQQMESLIYFPVVIPPAAVKMQYEMAHTEFNLRYAIINLPENIIADKIKKASEIYAKDFGHAAELQDLYAKEKDRFNQKAQTRVRSILISYQGASRAQGESLKRTKNDALKIMQDIQNKLKKGAPFEKLAVEFNDDDKAKQKQGDLGFVDETNIDTVSLHSISLLNTKNILSDIIDTPFGYRLFQYVDNKPAIEKTYQDVVVDLAKEAIGNKVKEQEEVIFQNQLAQSLATQNITIINKLLADNGLSWKYLNKGYFITDKNIAELGDATELAENIFFVKKSGDFIPRIIDFKGKKAILKLDSINNPLPPTETDLNLVRKQMTADQSKVFAETYQKELKKIYDKKGYIKINPMLTQ